MKKEVVISGIVGFVIGALFITYVPLDGGAGFQGKMTKFTTESKSDYDLKEVSESESSVKDKMEDAEFKSVEEISKNIHREEEAMQGGDEANAGNFAECNEQYMSNYEEHCAQLEGDEHDACDDKYAQEFQDCWDDRGDYQ